MSGFLAVPAMILLGWISRIEDRERRVNVAGGLIVGLVFGLVFGLAYGLKLLFCSSTGKRVVTWLAGD